MIFAEISAFTVLFGIGIFAFEYVRDATDQVIKDRDRAKEVAAITEQADGLKKMLRPSWYPLSRVSR